MPGENRIVHQPSILFRPHWSSPRAESLTGLMVEARGYCPPGPVKLVNTAFIAIAGKPGTANIITAPPGCQGAGGGRHRISPGSPPLPARGLIGGRR